MGAARINLEALLRARKLDNTLTSALPAPDVLPEQIVIPTGVAVLDERLHGGVPRGQVSEIVGPRSSGRAGLLVAMLAGATGRGEMTALVDPLDMFDAASAAAGGVDLGRLLWVRGEGYQGARVPRCQGAGAEGWDRAVDCAVKALNLVLQAGGFGLVALDLAEGPPSVVRRLPFTTWLRLQRVIEGSETVCVLLAADPVARSAGGVTIALRHSSQGPGAGDQGPGTRGQWLAAGGQRRARLFLGFDTEVRLSRARWPETTPCRIRFGSPVTCSP
jgi:recombination protein RecA